MQMFSVLRILYWKYAQKEDDNKILNFTITHADDILPTFKLMIAAVFFQWLMNHIKGIFNDFLQKII